MTGRYEGQQPNTEQDGEKLLRIMAMAAQAAGAQQAPADTRPAQANPGGMSEGDRMVSTARPGTGRDDAMQSLMQGDAGGSVPAGVAAETVIGPEEVAKAGEILQRYKTGKAALDKRIIENELWFRMGHWKNYQNKMMEGKPQPFSGWLFNSIANKHADAMDNYPEPNVLPRAADDEETARTLSKVIPAVLEQCNYEQVYSDTWWRKLKTGTGVKGIFWDPVLRGGLGDISIQSVNLLMLYWAPGVEGIQQSPHLFSLSLEDNEQLRGVPGGVVGGVQLGDHEPVFDIVDGKMNLQYFAATGATAASGRNREPRLGPWPAGHECRSRHEVDAGSHNPFGGMDLQLFADGDGGAAGEGGAEATPAEQPPQLSGQPEMQPQKGEKPTEEKPQEQKAEKTPEEKRKAFGALVRDGGEYSDIFNEVMQQAIIKAGEAVHTDPKATALPQALSEAYGIDGEDVDGLIEAVKNGKMKDNAY